MNNITKGTTVSERWKNFLSNKKERNIAIFSIAVLAVTLLRFSHFLNIIEMRDGVVLNDPLLRTFDPIDLTVFTFLIIYSSIIAALIYFSRYPKILFLAIQSYIVLTIFRFAAMYLLPLDPPARMIELADPFVEFFGSGRTFTKDLFFSGHTSLMLLLFLCSETKIFKICFLTGTILVAAAVILQHVHYSIDVLAAFAAAYTSFRLVKYIKSID